MIPGLIRVITLAMTLVATSPAGADEVTDLLFATGTLETLPEGTEIAYDHSRKGNDTPQFSAVTDGRILLSADTTQDKDILVLTLSAQGKAKETLSFPIQGGNPVLLVLLESTVRSMSAIAGGNPAYIRNRIKDSLRAGGEVADVQVNWDGKDHPARQITLHPFAQDANRSRMGEFADLTLGFVVSDVVPGRFLRLSADTPDAANGYHESITIAGGKVSP